MPLVEYRDLVDALVRDDTGKITFVQRDDAIAKAVARYSGDRPRTLVEDLVSAGGNHLDLPDGFDQAFSTLQALEYPIGRVPPTLIPNDRWRLYQSPGGITIMLLDAVAAGGTVRASYSAPHVLDESTDTIPPKHAEALASYAAALLLDQLASLFSGDTDSTVQADSVDHQSKAAEFAARARTLRRRYFDELGIDPKRNVAAGAVVALDTRDSLGGPRLTHGRPSWPLP